MRNSPYWLSGHFSALTGISVIGTLVVLPSIANLMDIVIKGVDEELFDRSIKTFDLRTRSIQLPEMIAVHTLEILMRGAAVGMNLILFMHFAVHFKTGWLARLGALFLFSTAVWTLYSSPVTSEMFGRLAPVGYFFSLFNSVFFWWFATALFDDEFRWKLWRFAPFAAIGGMQIVRLLMPTTVVADSTFFLHQLIVLAMMGHAMFLAISEAAHDLVEERRSFRIFFAASLAATGIVIAVVETADIFAPMVDQLSWLQATAILMLSTLFAFWLLSIKTSLLMSAPVGSTPRMPIGESSDGPSLRAADRMIFDKLMAMMEEGVYRREGLTVAQLASDVATPEHVLRRLINQELGHRNFSAFLNGWRIADAKRALGDPNKARDQVLQIALEVGYGSIGPFNRAFKDAEGMTPSEFRKKALGVR